MAPEERAPVAALVAEKLFRQADLSGIRFATTAELDELPGLPLRSRAMRPAT